MENKISNILQKQRNFFYTHKTKDINYRINNLKKLKKIIIDNEDKIADAIYKDLRKSKFESYETEIGIILEEIGYHLKNLKKWEKQKKVRTPIIYFPANSFIKPEPYGVVLIISPWNYPFQLLFTPLIGAISAGNCVVLKPAKYSTNTTKIIEELINNNFKPEYIKVFTGGREINQVLLKEKFDYIFFTGSQSLGKIVMESASKNLTPVTLELGGKNPSIVENDADLNIASKRIIWGKLLNAGQTCVSPDYLFVHKDIKNILIKKLQGAIIQYYGKDSKKSVDYPRIINKKQFERLKELMKSGNICFGGDIDEKERFIAPTIIDNVSIDDKIMKEEIFGPLVPIIEYEDLNYVINYINNNSKPLSLYFYSTDKNKQNRIINQTSSGACWINETILHIANPRMPFGGVGGSGMGQYHGKFSFDTFSHYKPIFKNKNFFDNSIRYAPYKNKIKIVKMLMK